MPANIQHVETYGQIIGENRDNIPVLGEYYRIRGSLY